MTKFRRAVASLLVVAGTLATAAPVAVALPKLDPLVTEHGVEPAQYRNYCARWRHACANRWGWSTWRYRRCITAHGCH